jgi:ankyrin repeat protein
VARYLAEELGVDSGRAMAEGRTPVFAACQGGHLPVLRYLLDGLGHVVLREGGRTLVARDDYGRSALWIACASGHLAVARHLAAALGVDPTWADAHGCPPLHVACAQNHLAVVRYLVEERAADAEWARPMSRSTALDACRRGSVCEVYLRCLRANDRVLASRQRLALAMSARRGPGAAEAVTKLTIDFGGGDLQELIGRHVRGDRDAGYRRAAGRTAREQLLLGWVEQPHDGASAADDAWPLNGLTVAGNGRLFHTNLD